MKKTFLTALVAGAMLSYAPQANAQGLLKKLKDKAGQVAGALLTPQNNKATTTATPVIGNELTDEEEPSTKPTGAAALMPIHALHVHPVSFSGILADEQAATGKTLTFSQLLATRIPYFEGSLLVSEEGRKKMEDAYMQMKTNITAFQNALLKESVATGQAMGNIQPPKVKMSAGQAEISREVMAAIQASGKNPASMTEAQMLDITANVVGKKLGIPAADMKKIYNMGGPDKAKEFIRKNYPKAEERARALGIVSVDDGGIDSQAYKIYTQLEQLRTKAHGSYEQMGNDMANMANQMQAALMGAQNGDEEAADKLNNLLNGDKQSKLEAMNKRYAEQWATSDACKRVDQITGSISDRIEKWIKDNPSTPKFPQWWVDNQKQGNTVVRQWNQEIATKFAKEIQTLETVDASILQKVAQLDDQLNKVSKTDAFYAPAKALVRQFMGDLFEYLQAPFNIEYCPQADYLNEDPTREDVGGKG